MAHINSQVRNTLVCCRFALIYGGICVYFAAAYRCRRDLKLEMVIARGPQKGEWNLSRYDRCNANISQLVPYSVYSVSRHFEYCYYKFSPPFTCTETSHLRFYLKLTRKNEAFSWEPFGPEISSEILK